MRRESAIVLPELVAELVRLKVDIIVVAGVHAAVRRPRSDQDDSHRHGEPWPILSRQVWLIALARPGGNVTGLTKLPEN